MARFERARMHTYNPATKQWMKSGVQIAIDDKPFAEGCFRLAYKAQMLYEGEMKMFVCKFAKDPATTRQMYFNDIEAQLCADMWAAQFNECRPPKQIFFVPCFVLEMVDRPGRPLCGCELYIDGEFKKSPLFPCECRVMYRQHNNNVGAVSHSGPTPDEKTQLDIDTAQAFSHFTYERSGRQILICDIQGVAGTYTDPQIHTVTGKGFGGGNLGMTGIRAFLLRHACNTICSVYCKLAPINSKALTESPSVKPLMVAGEGPGLGFPAGSSSTPLSSPTDSSYPSGPGWPSDGSGSGLASPRLGLVAPLALASARRFVGDSGYASSSRNARESSRRGHQGPGHGGLTSPRWGKLGAAAGSSAGVGTGTGVGREQEEEEKETGACGDTEEARSTSPPVERAAASAGSGPGRPREVEPIGLDSADEDLMNSILAGQ